MCNQQVYNLNGRQQGELKDRLGKLNIDFESIKKLKSVLKRKKRKLRIKIHSEIISWSFI